ncbi:MAG TPA: DUF6325 family protein [Nocardioides sp.]|jgi:hypothetical protein|uniref:DUF6325 family protein n=1 Tax=Nocardioides sp. TaxID=35761 RepID=UPI002CE9F04D|nr:DUF6325 family protein [Nocardioides sp.]HTW14029.1 DUF6325 family protein [Nocardioides sp.]
MVHGPDPDLVEYVVIGLPRLSSSTAVGQALRTLVESSRVRILDLVGVVTDSHGRYSVTEPESVAALSDLRGVEGEVGGLLSEDDIVLACRSLRPGASALILVVEDRWAQELADAARAGGGRIVGGERIPRHRLEQAERARRGTVLPDEELG